MQFFKSKRPTERPEDSHYFRSAQEAYIYLFGNLQKSGVDVEQASKRALEFSRQYAEAMQLPLKTETKESGVRGLLQEVKYVSEFFKENPTIVEIAKPILGGLLSTAAGAVAGTELAKETATPPNDPIIYDENELT